MTVRKLSQAYSSLELRGLGQIEVVGSGVAALKVLVAAFLAKACAINPKHLSLYNTSASQCITEAVNLRNRLIFKCPEGTSSMGLDGVATCSAIAGSCGLPAPSCHS